MTPATEAEIVAAIRREVAAALTQDGHAPAAREQTARELVIAALDRHAEACLAAGRGVLDPATEARIEGAVLDGLFGLGGLQRWLDDPNVENVNANGADRVFIRYRDG